MSYTQAEVRGWLLAILAENKADGRRWRKADIARYIARDRACVSRIMGDKPCQINVNVAEAIHRLHDLVVVQHLAIGPGYIII